MPADLSAARRLSGELKHHARELGFDEIGVASAAALDRDAAALFSWLDADRHAAMTWMARDPATRADPRELLAGCRSVVVVAMNYWPGEQAARVPAGRARVALYARGRDYHRVLGGRLRKLTAWLERESGQPARSFVDTGPVLERGWAERSGLGWIGKNANLIHRARGSWLLLGEILTRAELEPDSGPHPDHCGSCTACIDACPTDAIVADGVVDSRRCISYWTIEHRGPIPVERRMDSGEWIFGCDVCQEVCPWNRTFARPMRDDPFEVRPDLQGLDPEEILVMDESRFRARFSGTALMRAKWQGMRRNACLVLGSRGSVRALPTLALVLTDPDPVVRSHAAWAIRSIGGRDARNLLVVAVRDETSPEVLDEIDRGLREIGEC